MLRSLLSSLFILTFVLAGAQGINGYWKGRLVMEPGGCFPVYNIEFQIRVSGTTITGTSYHYSDTSNYVKEDFTGTYDSSTKSIQIEEQRVSVFRIPADCIPCIKKYTLTFHKEGKDEQLRGSWTGKTMDGKSICPAGTIVLNRIMQSAFEPPRPAILDSRTNVLIREIFVDTGMIQLDFYDNGEIDGDTITVYVNNIPIVTQRQISNRPVTSFVKMDQIRPTMDLYMVGNNLGSIPPNTALMIVNAGGKRYMVNLTSDMNKNAMVRFIYRRP